MAVDQLKVVPMSEFEQDPNANTGRFQAFVERGDEDARGRGVSASPALLIVAGVVIIAIIIVIVALA